MNILKAHNNKTNGSRLKTLFFLLFFPDIFFIASIFKVSLKSKLNKFYGSSGLFWNIKQIFLQSFSWRNRNYWENNNRNEKLNKLHMTYLNEHRENKYLGMLFKRLNFSTQLGVFYFIVFYFDKLINNKMQLFIITYSWTFISHYIS